MTEEQWKELEPFARRYSEATVAWQNAQVMNQPREDRERIEIQIFVEKITAELQASRRKLDEAKERILK